MKPETAVIVLTHNKLDCTRKCLGQLLHTRGRDWELIVVDNGSEDGTREWLAAFKIRAAADGLTVTVIHNDGNIGCSTARNQGAAKAAGSVRYLAFADNDVTVRSRTWLSTMAAALEADHELGMVGPKLVYPFAPYPIQFAGGAVTPTGRVVFMGRGEPCDQPEFNRACDVQCCISACCMLPRRAFEAVGGFDEWFNPVEYEDIDLCYRLRGRGWRIRYLPEVEMYHFENVTTQGTARLPNAYLIIRNGLRFKQRWRVMFAAENGPPDTAARWRRLDVPPFDDRAELPVQD